MRPDDFFIDESPSSDPWSSPAQTLDEALVRHVLAGPLIDRSDLEVAAALTRLVHQEYEERATENRTRISEGDSRALLAALGAVLKRLGIDFTVPFSDFRSFYQFWRREGMTGDGSWAARRDYLSSLFGPIHERLADLEAGSLQAFLAQPATAHPRTGWTRVDDEIAELRRHFRSARTPQDYRNVGNDCVIVMERISEVAYDPVEHLPDGEAEPTVASTKARLDRVVEVDLPGPGNAELRKLVRAAIEQAQAVKHRAPDRRQAGIAADSVILLANIMRRIRLP